MPILEDMIMVFEDVSKQLSNMHNKISELEVQKEEDILWTLDDLKKYMQFKSYTQIKAETEKEGFPKVLIGNTERYPKKLVIKFYNELAIKEKTEQKQELFFKGKKSALYQV
ncbi:hypothetical protein [Vallitalea guaymasensis]|uniref:hypothetical protein n=1 Tax=Vallitalea guaymasensis TaxID=1185412 RepID=UPI000DE279D8|nr:hypothetical protein [Vallitalea guaymasensis]